MAMAMEMGMAMEMVSVCLLCYHSNNSDHNQSLPFIVFSIVDDDKAKSTHIQ